MPKIAFIGAGSAIFTRGPRRRPALSYEELRGRRDRAARHRPRAPRDGRGGRARWTNERLDAGAAISGHPERRAALDGADFVINMVQVGGHAATLRGPRDPRAPRAAPDDRRHARHRRHLPRAAHHPGAARRRRATWPSCARTPGCSTTRTRWRSSCQAYAEGSPHTRIVGLCHSVQNTTRELAELRAAFRSRRSSSSARASTTRRSSSASSATARTSTRAWTSAIEARPRAAPQGARGDVPAARLLPDGVQRALGRVPAVVHARTTRQRRALPRHGERVRAPQRGEPRRVRAHPRRAARAGEALDDRARASSTRRRSSTR